MIVQLAPNSEKSLVCTDSGTSMTIIDRKIKDVSIPDVYIHTIAVHTRVRGIGNDIYEISEYIIYEIYLPNSTDKDSKIVIAKTAIREIYLVDSLAAGILIGNDVLVPEGINLLFSKKVAHIRSYRVDVSIEV